MSLFPVSYFLGTHGPSVTLETACSSSLVAMALAANALSLGDCDTAVVVGINYLSEKDFHLSLQACGVLVQGPACHPFDEDGPKGFFRAEGMGCVVLRRMSDAERLGNRVLVKLARAVAASAGAADNSLDGAGRVYEQPCPNGMRNMYMRAFSSAGIPYRRLNYMECHATGTAVGDVIEVDAVGSVFGESHDLETNPIRIASIKSNIGHAEVAAGIFSVIKIVQMMKHRVYLPTAGVTKPRTDFDWDANNMRVQQEIEPFPEGGEPVVAGISSFGIGGSYGHVILEEYRGSVGSMVKPAAALPPAAADLPSNYILPLSAVSLAHLKLFAERMAAYVGEKKDTLALRDLCGTMWVNRTRFKFRKAFIASSLENLQQSLSAFAASGNVQPAGEGRKMQVAYVFTGQGSQWPGVGKSLMAFPVYKESVEAVDKIFKGLAGWSILEKAETLSAEEMRDTVYAQPISFIVQVGLFELLKFFRVFPDVVTGHSAGEVAAAYAAGLLTLEEAVLIVYHRSQEQQKMAGCGRLMVVGLPHERVLEYISGQDDIEVACVNSPESVVLASSEARLNEIKGLFPEGTALTFVQGNIAFHSSRMIPVLESIKKRLSFLDKRGETGWSLPFISTVTGKVETDVDTEYWCKNVRYPVLFQKALETAFAGDTVPDVVLEIGPHQTLVSPIKQVLGATGKNAAVFPTLKKGAPCALRFLEALGNLFERGAELDLEPWYAAMKYCFEEDMPKHPFIKKAFYEVLPTMRFDMRFGQYHDGPVAGKQRFFDGAFLVEVSDRTFKGMLGHRMGGKTILPGMFFVEMALEASRTYPVTLANVEFKAMCRIPVASKGEIPSMIGLTFSDVKDDIRSFEVRSAPIRDKADEDPVYVTHCTGLAIKSKLLEKDGSIYKGFKPEAYGIMGGLELQDIGEAGLKELIDVHSDCKHVSKEAFYGHYCVEGVMEWLNGFQLIQSAHLDPADKTILAKIKYDNRRWVQTGGVFGVEFLDSVIHPLLMLADDSAVYYAGGFDAGHFLRQPATDELYVYLIPDKSRMVIGRKQKIGDFAVYDSLGTLIMYIQGFFSIIGSIIDNYKLCDLLWQPYDAAFAKAPLAIEATPAAATDDSTWTVAKNQDLTAFLVKELEATGVLSPEAVAAAAAEAAASTNGRKPRGPVKPPLSQQVREAIERECTPSRVSSETPAFPKAGGLDEIGVGLAQAIAAKIKPSVSVTSDSSATNEEEKPRELTGEDVGELIATSTFQVSEAARVAAALKELMLANQEVFGKNYVFRILELAEERVHTVFEALSLLELPTCVTVEVFVGSFNAGLLMSLANKIAKRAPNVLLRRVLMSEKPEKELKDITFDAVVLNEWIRTGSAAFAEGKSAKAPSNAILYLAPFLAPSAQVFIRGLIDVPLWVTLVSQVSTAALPFTDATDQVKNARDEWTDALALSGGFKTIAADSLLVGTIKGLPTAQAGRYLVVADHLQAGTDLRRRIGALNSACVAEVIVVGEGGSLTDSSSVEDYESAINGLVGSDSSCEESDFSDITTDSSTAVEEGLGALPFKGVVFLAGLNDRSQVGEAAFGRLLKLAQALLKCTEKPSSLWLVTNGVYLGEIKPAQGVIQGFSTVLKSELNGVATKHVDLADTETGLGPLAQLVLANAAEMTYAVSEAGEVLVPRFNAVDKAAARSDSVLANDTKVSFFADVEKQTTPGKIGAKFRLQELPAPKADEVTVDVYAAALNFRDVMIALSLLPEKSYEASFYGKNLGLEASGVVTAVGSGVKNLKVGDKVLLNEPRCLTNRLNAPAYRVVPFGGLKMSFEDAASIQSVYNTSHHALINLARIRKGETVLIHSAAGGIGHAAISIAKHVGATIYATAGSEEKRQLVRDMGVTHVFNSRSTEWFDDLMRETDGKGVDVILNSLAGKHQRLGIQALRSSGRFLEIGKMDIFDNNGLDLLAFRKNISFFAIDMDRMVLDNPTLATEVAIEVGKNFEACNYDLIPTQVFPMDKMKEALDLMKTGKHVGKIVLTNYTKVGEGKTARYEPLPVVVEKPQNIFHEDATYLITGGAGGFGSAMVRYAFDHGAKHFLITTRSANTEKVKASFSDLTKNPGVTLEVVTTDTGKEEDVKALCAKAKAMSPPTKSIFHVAGVSVDVLLPEMKPENYVEVADCKARGAWFLHENSLDMHLENFVCVSSIAALIGGPGMASYSASNAYLDALMRYRRSQGLAAAAFNMASLSDVGILKNNLSARKFQLKVGMEFMSSTRAMEMLETGLMVGMNPIVTMFFKEQTRDMFPSQAAWSHQLGEAISLGAVAASNSFMSAKEIAAFLADEIRSITGVTTVLVTAQLTALGLDSLGFVELGGRMKKHFNVEMDAVKMSPDMTLEDVAKMIFKLQARSGGNGKADASSADQGADLHVLHSKAEMNSMISSRFERADSIKHIPPAKLLRLNSLRASSVLLFGAEYLNGAHMLRYLIKGGARTVYCVGPWATTEGGLIKIERSMRELALWKDSFAKHIIPVTGDVSKKDFGMKGPAYDELAASVDTIVHSGGSLKWAMDADLVPTNISGLMNVIAMARKTGASIHYLSSSSLTAIENAEHQDRDILRPVPYFDVKRKAEDILQFAARHYDLRCFIYRLPYITPNMKGRFGTSYAKDLVLVRFMQCIQDSGLFPSTEMGNHVLYVISADAAAKFVVRHMRHTSTSAKKTAVRYFVTSESTGLPMSTLADWVEEKTGRPLDRTATVADMRAYMSKRFKYEINLVYSSIFFDMLPALCRGGARSTAKNLHEVSAFKQIIRHASRVRTQMDNVHAFKSYVQQESTLLQIEEDILRDQDEDLTEEAKDELLVQKEQASAGLP